MGDVGVGNHNVLKAELQGATKVLKQYSDKHMRALLKEVRAMRRYPHEHLAHVDGVFYSVEDQAYYMVMPYYANGSLADFIAVPGDMTKKRLSDENKLRVFKEVIQPCIYVHICLGALA